MDDLEKLYNVLKREGYYTKSFEEFQSKWGDKAYQAKVYGVVSRDKLYTKDEESFLAKYNSVEKKNQISTSEDPKLVSAQKVAVGSSVTPQNEGQLKDFTPKFFDKHLEDAPEATEPKQKQNRAPKGINRTTDVQLDQYPEGETSTVLMTSYGSHKNENGKYTAFPTLFPKDPNNQTSDPKDWIVAENDDQAYEIAKERGEVLEFDTPEEADAVAKGSWKTKQESQATNAFENTFKKAGEALKKSNERIERAISIRNNTISNNKNVEEIYNIKDSDKEEYRSFVDSKIKAKKLDQENPFIASKDSIATEYVDNAFSSTELEKLGINTDDFDGFITEKGYKQDYIDKQNKDLYNTDGVSATASNEKLADEMDRWKMLMLYMAEKDKRLNLKRKYDTEKEYGYEVFDIDPIGDKKLSGGIPVTNYEQEKIKKYIEKNFPLFTEKLNEKKENDKALYDKHVNGDTGFWYGVGKLGTKGWEGFEDRVNDLSATFYDKVGMDDVADGIRDAAVQAKFFRTNTRDIVYTRGKSVTHNDTEYIVDGNKIINKELKIDVTDILNPFEAKAIKSNSKNGKIDSVFSTQGAFMQTSSVLTDMAVQLAFQASLNRLGVKGLTSAFIAQGSLGYSSGFEQAYKDAKDIGLDENTAKEVASVIGVEMAAWYGATSFISPQTKATESIFGISKMKITQSAINAYKQGGKKGLKDYLNTISKNFIPKATQKTALFFEEGGKEVVQENVQQAGDVGIINKEFNRLVEKEFRPTEQSVSDIVTTSIISLVAGGLPATIDLKKHGGFDSKIEALKALSDNNNGNIDKVLAPLVKNGTITAKEASTILSDFAMYEEFKGSIPADTDPDSAFDIMNGLNDIKKLEAKKKKLDPVFHEKIDIEIAQKRKEIGLKYNSPDTEATFEVTREEAIQSLVDAANLETKNTGVGVIPDLSEENILRRVEQLSKEKQDAIDNDTKSKALVTPERIKAKIAEIKKRDTESISSITEADAYKQAVRELDSKGEGIVTPEAIKARAEEIKNESSFKNKSEAEIYKQAVREVEQEVEESIQKDNDKSQKDAEKAEKQSLETFTPKTQTESEKGVANETQTQGDLATDGDVQSGTKGSVQQGEGVLPQSESDSGKTKGEVSEAEGKITKEEQQEIDDLINNALGAVENGESQDIAKTKKQVKKAKKAIGDKNKVVLPETEEEFNKIAGNKDGRKQLGGHYDAVNDIIYINPNRANKRSVAHEVFHHFILSKLKSNPKAQAVTEKMMESLKNDKTIPDEVKADLDKFSKQYTKSIQAEEWQAEFVGWLSAQYEGFSESTKETIKRWLREIADLVGMNIFKETISDNEVMNMLHIIAKKTALGQKITKGDVSLIDKLDVSKKQDGKNGEASSRNQLTEKESTSISNKITSKTVKGKNLPTFVQFKKPKGKEEYLAFEGEISQENVRENMPQSYNTQASKFVGYNTFGLDKVEILNKSLEGATKKDIVKRLNENVKILNSKAISIKNEIKKLQATKLKTRNKEQQAKFKKDKNTKLKIRRESIKTINQIKRVRNLNTQLELLNKIPIKIHADALYNAMFFKLGDGAKKLSTKEALSKSDDIYKTAKEIVKSNLLAVYNKILPSIRKISKLWYDGANLIAQDMSKKYNVSIEQASAIIATQSPQMPWFDNLHLADVIMDTMTSQADKVFTQKMFDYYVLKAQSYADQKKYIPTLKKIIGKPLSELSNYDAGIFIRVDYDLNISRKAPIRIPTGTTVAESQTGDSSFSGYNVIEKGVSVYRDGSIDNISKEIGRANKVRNFYLNIVDPSNKRAVTIDTHAMAIGLMKPLASNDFEVNFDPASFAFYADAYRELAEELGIEARALQSITWEGARAIFPAKQKAKDGYKNSISYIWDKFNKGEISLEDVQNEIFKQAENPNITEWSEFVKILKDGKKRNNVSGRIIRSDGTNPNDKLGDVSRTGIGVSALKGRPTNINGRPSVTSREQKTYPIGITNALTTEQVEGLKGTVSETEYKTLKRVSDNMDAARKLEQKGNVTGAKRLYNKVLDVSEKRLADLFSDLKDVSIKIVRSQGTFFAETEPTFEYTITDNGNNLDEIAKRLADVANNEFHQESVHISEIIDNEIPPNGLEFGEQQPDGSVYEPNIEIRVGKKLSEKAFAEIETLMQENGLAGSTRFSDKKGIYLYNLTVFKDNGEFIEQAKSATKKLLAKGIQPKVRRSVRKLWNIGKSAGENFVSYEQAQNLSRSFPQKVDLTSRYQKIDVEAPAFEKWVGDRQELSGTDIQDAKTGEPIVVKVYHGTTNEFYEFDSTVKGNKGGHFGAVNYFTSDYGDADQNYQSDGADLTGRIEQIEERIVGDLENEGVETFDEIYDYVSENYPDFDVSSLDETTDFNEVANRVASSLLNGGEDLTLDLYVRMDNPVVLGGDSSWVEVIPKDLYEYEIEDATQEVADENDITIEEAQEDHQWEIDEKAMEMAGVENPFIEALQDAIDNNTYNGEVNGNTAGTIIADFVYEQEVDLNQLETKLREELSYAEDENGELTSSQIIADFFKNLGYDGIIITNPSQRFKGMNLGRGTSHIHIADENSNNIKLADGTNTTFDENSRDIRQQIVNAIDSDLDKLNNPIWRSTAQEGVAKLKLQPSKPDVWVKKIAEAGGRGTKQELDWIGLEDFLNDWMKDNGKKSVPKDVVEQYIKDNQIEIKEVTKSEIKEKRKEEIRQKIKENKNKISFLLKDPSNENLLIGKKLEDENRELNKEFRAKSNTQYSNYQLEGGENYREVLLTLPKKPKDNYSVVKTNNLGIAPYQVKNNTTGEIIKSNFTTEDRANREVEKLNKTEGTYKSSHWDESNILAHVRMNERTLPNGERVLFIEEVQSDWAQEGKKRGFTKTENKKRIKELENKKQEVLDNSNSYKILNKKTDGDLGVKVFNAFEQQATNNIDNKYYTPKSRKENFLKNINRVVNYWGKSNATPKMTQEEWSRFYDTYINELKDNSVKITGYGTSYRLASIDNEITSINAEIFKNKAKEGTPNMPYKKTDQWVGMAMRRVMKMAVDEGFKRIAWVTGEQSSDRYSLRSQVDKIDIAQPIDNYRQFYVLLKNNADFAFTTNNDGLITDSSPAEFKGKNLEDVVGKEMAKKLLEAKEETTLQDVDLEVGGEGMKAFYNSIVPKIAKNEAQRFDKKAKVEVVEIDKIKLERPKIIKNSFGGFDVIEIGKTGVANVFKTKQEAQDYIDKSKSKQLSIALTPKMESALETPISRFQKTGLSGMPPATNRDVLNAMKNANTGKNSVADIQKAGIDKMKESDWYKALSEKEQKAAVKKVEDFFTKPVGKALGTLKASEQKKSDRRAENLKTTEKKLRQQYKDEKEFKKMLIRRVKEKLDAEDIPYTTKSQIVLMMNRINNASMANMPKLVSALDTEISIIKHRRAKDKLLGILKNPKKYIQKVNGKSKAKTIDNATRKRVVFITKWSNKTSTDITKELRELGSELSDANLEQYVDLHIALDIAVGRELGKESKAYKKSDIAFEYTLDEATMYNDRAYRLLDALINKGKSDLREQIKQEAERLKAIGEEGALATEHKYSGLTQSQLQDVVHKRKNKLFKVLFGSVDAVKKYNLKPVVNSFEFLLGYIDHVDEHGAGTIYDRFYKGENGLVQKDADFAHDKRMIMKDLQSAINKILGKKFNNIFNDYFYAKAVNKVQDSGIDIINEDGKVERKSLSKNQALYVHLVAKMPSAREKLENQGWSEESFKQLDAFLGAKYLEISDFITEMLENKYDKYNKVHLELLRTDLGFEEGYFPTKYDGMDMKADVELGGNNFSMPGVMPGNIISKVKNNNRIDITQNAFDVLSQYYDSMERFYHYGRFVKDLNSLLNNKRFKSNVNNYDDTAYKDLVKMSRAVTGDKSDFEVDDVEKALYGLNAAIASGYIVFKGYTALKQFLSMPAYTEFAEAFKIGNTEIPLFHKTYFGVKMALQMNPYHIIKNYRMLHKKSSHFRDRMRRGSVGDEFIEALLNSKNRKSSLMMDLFKWFAKRGIFPNKLIDALTISTGGAVLYNQQLRKYKKAGLTPAKAEAQAIRDFEIGFKKTQQSSDLGNLGSVQIRKGALTSLFVPFKNAQFGYLRRIMANSNNIVKRFEREKLRQVRLGKNNRIAGVKALAKVSKTGKTYNELQNILLYTHVLPLIWQYVASGLPGLLTAWDDDDEEEMKRAARLGAIDGLFILNDLSKFAYNTFVLKKRWNLQQSILLNEIEKGVKAIAKASADSGSFNTNVLLEIGKAWLVTKGVQIDTGKSIYDGVEGLIMDEEGTQENIMKILKAPKELTGGDGRGERTERKEGARSTTRKARK